MVFLFSELFVLVLPEEIRWDILEV